MLSTNHLTHEGLHVRRACSGDRTALADLRQADGDLCGQTGHVAGGVGRQGRKNDLLGGPTDR